MTTLNLRSENDIRTITTMVFKDQDVLTTEREKMKRNASLLRASLLDSLHQLAVVLHVEDMESTRKVRSRIIATGDERVMLEQGLSIPVHCIRVIEFPS